ADKAVLDQLQTWDEQGYGKLPICMAKTQYYLTAAISASVSETKWLIATTTGTPKRRTLETCRPRLAQPFFSAATSYVPRSSFFTPPFIFSARTV
ncbi:hypothetical protein, partial [Rhizobium leguminosarum]|uniref:hypothetical protein n=1 Tax=Rhizobium leguminosarum TaxID=384 RepID=UPI003F98380E